MSWQSRCLPQSQRAVQKWKLQIVGLHLIWNMALLGNPPTLTGGAGAEAWTPHHCLNKALFDFQI